MFAAVDTPLLHKLRAGSIEGANEKAGDGRSSNQTIVALLGALFGHDISSVDQAELLKTLDYVNEIDVELAADFRALAHFVDALARQFGSTDFISATARQRESTLHELMDVDPFSLAARVRARLSDQRRTHHSLRTSTIPRLARLYRACGVAWRRRGYERWPGIPGRWDEYVTEGRPYP